MMRLHNSMILIILKWLLESVSASEAEISIFQKWGVAGIKNGGFRYPPHGVGL